MTTMSARRAAGLRRCCAATALACHSASWLPRVPSRSSSWRRVWLDRALAARMRADAARPSSPAARARSVDASSPRPNSRSSASVYAPTVSASPSALSCSVGVEQQLLDDQARDLVDARARFGRQARDSLNSSRSSSARRIASNRCRSATTVGTAPRERSHAPNLSTSSSTIASARVDLAGAAREVLAHRWPAGRRCCRGTPARFRRPPPRRRAARRCR